MTPRRPHRTGPGTTRRKILLGNRVGIAVERKRSLRSSRRASKIFRVGSFFPAQSTTWAGIFFAHRCSLNAGPRAAVESQALVFGWSLRWDSVKAEAVFRQPASSASNHNRNVEETLGQIRAGAGIQRTAPALNFGGDSDLWPSKSSPVRLCAVGTGSCKTTHRRASKRNRPSRRCDRQAQQCAEFESVVGVPLTGAKNRCKQRQVTLETTRITSALRVGKCKTTGFLSVGGVPSLLAVCLDAGWRVRGWGRADQYRAEPDTDSVQVQVQTAKN